MTNRIGDTTYHIQDSRSVALVTMSLKDKNLQEYKSEFKSMNRDNQTLLTDELPEFEKQLVEVSKTQHNWQ